MAKSPARSLATSIPTRKPVSGAVIEPPAAYSVPEFCDLHRFSRAHLYKLWKDGLGPDRMRVGGRTLISAEAAARWRQRMELIGSGEGK